jgi:D-alanyl-lipoteichoic acid acyltransferase DltB (MBOAT superfamily)
LHSRIFQEILPSFGAGGTYHYQAGLKTTCTFHLGGSKGGLWMQIRNTFIIFIVSGFWHGANWTFIIWGALNALFIMPSIIFKTNRNNLEIVAKGKCTAYINRVFQYCINIFINSAGMDIFSGLTSS